MMIPVKLKRGKTTGAYKVVYNVNQWYQANWRDHLLSSQSRSDQVKFSWECSSDYMEWYLKITYPYVQVSMLRITPKTIREESEKENAFLKSVINNAVGVLQSAMGSDRTQTISLAANQALYILLDAMQQGTTEAESDSRTKRTHDPSQGAKGKGPAKKKQRKI